jgi:hypothetical protein
MLCGVCEHAYYGEATMYGYSKAARLGVFLWYIAFDGLPFDLLLITCRFSFHNFRRFQKHLSQNKFQIGLTAILK